MIAQVTKNVSVKVVSVDSNYYSNYGETVAVQSSVGPVTIYLPDPQNNSHVAVFDQDGNSATHPITIDAGSYQIDGSNIFQVNTNFAAVAFVSDGFFWKITSQTFSNDIAGGDLSGSYPNPTISKIQGRNVSNIDPTPGQTLVWTGSSWAPGNVSGSSGGGGGGGGFVYYLNYSNDGYDIPSNWKEMSLIPSQSPNITSDTTLTDPEVYYTVAQFVSVENNPSTNIIPGGVWDLNLYLSYMGDSNESYFRTKVFVWDGYNQTILGTSPNVFIDNPSEISLYNCSVQIPTTNINYSDRIGIEIEAGRTTGSTSTNFFAYFEGEYVSHTHTTLEAPGGTGVVKVVDGIFQTPASLIVDADVSLTAAIVGSKITSATNSELGVIQLNGDLDGTATSPKVIAIQNNPVSSTSPNVGNRLTWNGSSWAPASEWTFPSNITVSLSSGKTLGRYSSGETIPSLGKTTAEVLQLLAVEPINPTVSLTSSTSVQFNQTNISNLLNFSYIINSLGGVVSSASLEWRRNNTGSWVQLSTSTSSPESYTHSLTDSNFNSSTFNYRYTVTDNLGASATSTVDITPAAYAAPTISLTVAAVSSTSPETNVKREVGNVNTNLNGSVTRNSSQVGLVSYVLQYQVNGGGWNDIGSPISISGSSFSIPVTNHNPTSSKTASSIGYRIKVVDDYTTSYSSVTTISFLNLIFYGPASSAPGTSSEVRALGSRIFIDGSNPFTLNTGSVEKIFSACMPFSNSITEVLDLDSLNANITANYVLSTFNVDDAGGTSTAYRVYTMTNAVAYSSNHRHQITRS